MASQANLTLADGQATPVNHTFFTNGAGWVDSIDGILAKWIDRSQAAAVGFWKVSMSFKEPNKNRKNYLVVLKTEVPVLEVVNAATYNGITPAPTISYNPIAKTEFSMAERSTIAARKDLLAVHKNLLGNAIVTSAVQDLEPTT